MVGRWEFEFHKTVALRPERGAEEQERSKKEFAGIPCLGNVSKYYSAMEECSTCKP